MEQNADLESLSSALLKVRNKEEAGKLLQDLFSKTELETLKLRFRIAKLLSKGESYVDIERQTGASSATIAKMSEAIKYGNEGLRTVLERMKRK